MMNIEDTISSQLDDSQEQMQPLDTLFFELDAGSLAGATYDQIANMPSLVDFLKQFVRDKEDPTRDLSDIESREEIIAALLGIGELPEEMFSDEYEGGSTQNTLILSVLKDQALAIKHTQGDLGLLASDVHGSEGLEVTPDVQIDIPVALEYDDPALENETRTITINFRITSENYGDLDSIFTLSNFFTTYIDGDISLLRSAEDRIPLLKKMLEEGYITEDNSAGNTLENYAGELGQNNWFLGGLKTFLRTAWDTDQAGETQNDDSAQENVGGVRSPAGANDMMQVSESFTDAEPPQVREPNQKNIDTDLLDTDTPDVIDEGRVGGVLQTLFRDIENLSDRSAIYDQFEKRENERFYREGDSEVALTLEEDIAALDVLQYIQEMTEILTADNVDDYKSFPSVLQDLIISLRTHEQILPAYALPSTQNYLMTIFSVTDTDIGLGIQYLIDLYRFGAATPDYESLIQSGEIVLYQDRLRGQSSEANITGRLRTGIEEYENALKGPNRFGHENRITNAVEGAHPQVVGMTQGRIDRIYSILGSNNDIIDITPQQIRSYIMNDYAVLPQATGEQRRMIEQEIASKEEWYSEDFVPTADRFFSTLLTEISSSQRQDWLLDPERLDDIQTRIDAGEISTLNELIEGLFSTKRDNIPIRLTRDPLDTVLLRRQSDINILENTYNNATTTLSSTYDLPSVDQLYEEYRAFVSADPDMDSTQIMTLEQFMRYTLSQNRSIQYLEIGRMDSVLDMVMFYIRNEFPDVYATHLTQSGISSLSGQERTVRRKSLVSDINAIKETTSSSFDKLDAIFTIMARNNIEDPIYDFLTQSFPTRRERIEHISKLISDEEIKTYLDSSTLADLPSFVMSDVGMSDDGGLSIESYTIGSARPLSTLENYLTYKSTVDAVVPLPDGTTDDFSRYPLPELYNEEPLPAIYMSPSPISINFTNGLPASNDYFTIATTPSFAGTGNPGDTISFRIGNETQDTTVNDDGEWSVAFSDTLTPDSTYSISISLNERSRNSRLTVRNVVDKKQQLFAIAVNQSNREQRAELIATAIHLLYPDTPITYTQTVLSHYNLPFFFFNIDTTPASTFQTPAANIDTEERNAAEIPLVAGRPIVTNIQEELSQEQDPDRVYYNLSELSFFQEVMPTSGERQQLIDHLRSVLTDPSINPHLYSMLLYRLSDEDRAHLVAVEPVDPDDEDNNNRNTAFLNAIVNADYIVQNLESGSLELAVDRAKRQLEQHSFTDMVLYQKILDNIDDAAGESGATVVQYDWSLQFYGTYEQIQSVIEEYGIVLPENTIAQRDSAQEGDTMLYSLVVANSRVVAVSPDELPEFQPQGSDTSPLSDAPRSSDQNESTDLPTSVVSDEEADVESVATRAKAFLGPNALPTEILDRVDQTNVRTFVESLFAEIYGDQLGLLRGDLRARINTIADNPNPGSAESNIALQNFVLEYGNHFIPPMNLDDRLADGAIIESSEGIYVDATTLNVVYIDIRKISPETNIADIIHRENTI